MELIDSINDFSGIIAGGSISAILIAVFRKFIIEISLHFYNKIVSIFKKIIDFVFVGFDIKKTIKEIQAELKPNGGSSLRDAINKIEKRVDEISENLNSLKVSHEILSEVVGKPSFRSDSKGNILYWSDSLCRLCGISKANEYMGLKWLSFVHDDDRETIKEEWISTIKDQRMFLGKFKIINPYNSKVYSIIAKATPVHDDKSKKVIGWEGIITHFDEVSKNEED